ncbi:MAG TPA: DUF2378 family protein [Chloroflexia bacterium]|nr:DUF2378 family protein [Chloroflexia bacterium]
MEQKPEKTETPIAQRVVYQTALEALTHAVQADQHPELIAELKAVGYDLQRPRREYTPDTLVTVINLLADRCFPDKSREEAYKEFGRRAFEAYRSTVAGRVVLASLKTATLPKALKLFSQGIATATNFSTYEVLTIGASSLVLRAQQSVSPPYYIIGMLESLLIDSGHPEVQVRLLDDHYPTQIDYELRW